MFEWRFRITPGIIPLPFLETAYFAGWGRNPRLSKTTVIENELIVYAESFGSGTIHVPMFHAPLGVIMESTESLMGRRTPYLLVRELTRGALGRFNRRLFDWQMLGYRQPQEHEDRLRRLTKRFSAVVTKDILSSEIEQEFAAIMDEIAPLIVDENREFAEQSLSWRTRNDERLRITLGVGLDFRHIATLHEFDSYAKFIDDSFHAVLPTPSWRELEPQPGQFDWERLEKLLSLSSRFGFQMVLGPLLSFCTEAIPDWIVPKLSEEGYF